MKRTLTIAVAGLTAFWQAGAAPAASHLFFVPNRGQAVGTARFMVKGSGISAFFGPSEVAFRTREGVVRMRFPGASGPSAIEPGQQLPGVVNFLKGPEAEWRTGLPMYGGIVYRDLYPGIDMVYGSDGRKLKSQFVVAPGADPSRILVEYSGAGGLRIDDDGSLVVLVGGRAVREQAPVVYQQVNGERVPVEGRFTLFGDAVGFVIGPYDRAIPLVIDPTVTYSTLLGGSSSDAAMSLAVDTTGAAYIAGFTASFDLPRANPEQNFDAGGNDVFVAKINASGNALVYCTYIGGRADDRANAITVDSTGAAYVTGSTTSANFPMRNPMQPRLAGGRNAFVLKLSPAGNTLVFSSYLGGNGMDAGNGIARDTSGNLYVAGDTTSTTFPTTALQRSNRGGQDAFVAKLAADGSRILYATYLGGALDDHASGIAVDAGGSAYVAGSTWSTDFPVANAYQNKLAGGQDAFVTRIAAAGTSLLFSTYLGGSSGTAGAPESAYGIALDAQGAAYITGATSSTNFPVLNPEQSALRGPSDAFVSKISATGALVYSTYVGGTGRDSANGIAVDGSGNAYLAGQATVPDLAAPVQSMTPGDYDVFAAELNTSGNVLVAAVTVTSTGSDTATDIALDNSYNVYLAGWTLASDFPVINGIQTTNGGGYGAFLAKVSFVANTPITVDVLPGASTLYPGQSQQFTATVAHTSNTAVTWSITPVVGSITSAGLYTAPASITSQQTVTVTATSVADPTRSGGSLVTLTPNTITETNLALGKPATQSSTYSAAYAAKAVDGSTDGVFNDNSVSHTGGDANAWWQVDLGASANISAIKIWNRTDCCMNRLSDYWVFASDTPFSATETPATLQSRAGIWMSHQTADPNPTSTIFVNARGRYVRVQLSGTDFLHMAEVQVFGAYVPPPVTISLTPTAATLSAGQTQQFTPTVANTSYTAVSWTLNPKVGSINSAGLYTAPATITSPQTITLTATSLADPTKSASATIVLSTAPVGTNLAVGKQAAQSSTYGNAVAANAVDGNTDGAFNDSSVSHTGGDPRAWWQVDLGASVNVSAVKIWNRTDCCMDRLSDYWVFVSDTPFGPNDTPATLQSRAGTWSSHQTAYPNPSATIMANAQGRYVRVQLSTGTFLHIAEVQVIGTWR